MTPIADAFDLPFIDDIFVKNGVEPRLVESTKDSDTFVTLHLDLPEKAGGSQFADIALPDPLTRWASCRTVVRRDGSNARRKSLTPSLRNGRESSCV